MNPSKQRNKNSFPLTRGPLVSCRLDISLEQREQRCLRKLLGTDCYNALYSEKPIQKEAGQKKPKAPMFGMFGSDRRENTATTKPRTD